MSSLHFFQHGSEELIASESIRNEYLDFSVNTNPWGPPASVHEILSKSQSVEYYPEIDSGKLKERLAILYGIQPDQILVGNGSSQVIYLAAGLRRGERAFIYLPTFSEYERSLRANNCKISFAAAKENGTFYFLLEDRLIRRKISQSDIVFLGNPNNPTGSLISRANLLQAIDSNPKTLFVIDEVFIDFSDIKQSVLSDAVGRKNLIVIRSLTKLFAIPGIRIGYAVAHPKTIAELARRQPPWSVNSLAQEVGTRLLEERQFIEESRQKMQQAYLLFFEALSQVSWLRPYPSRANYILCRILLDEGLSSGLLQKRLFERKILIRNCDNFRGLEKRRFIRLAVRLERENLELVRTLKEIEI